VAVREESSVRGLDSRLRISLVLGGRTEVAVFGAAGVAAPRLISCSIWSRISGSMLLS